MTAATSSCCTSPRAAPPGPAPDIRPPSSNDGNDPYWVIVSTKSWALGSHTGADDDDEIKGPEGFTFSGHEAVVAYEPGQDYEEAREEDPGPHVGEDLPFLPSPDLREHLGQVLGQAEVGAHAAHHHSAAAIAASSATSRFWP